MGEIDRAAVGALGIATAALAVEVFCIRVLRLSRTGRRHTIVSVVYMLTLLTGGGWLIADMFHFVAANTNMPAFFFFGFLWLALLFAIAAVVDRRRCGARAARARGPR